MASSVENGRRRHRCRSSQAHPEHAGVALMDLRNALATALTLNELFDPPLSGLCERGFLRPGAVIRRGSHRAALPEALRAAGAQLRETLSARPARSSVAKGFSPRSNLAAGAAVPARDGRSRGNQHGRRDGGIVGRTGYGLVRIFITENGPATVSELRQVLGSSRRVVVPLLEYFDRTFVTVRQGDRRAMRR